MASPISTPPEVIYPHSDGKPVGETPEHAENLLHLVEMLRQWFNDDEMTYVGGNNFIYYERGNPRRHVSPDVFVGRGIPKLPRRRRYLVWEEHKAPDLVIELTSTSTVKEDQERKYALYRDVLRVREYFLFDPLGECLKPRLQGFRLRQGAYVPIRRLRGRLPSKILGLHLEQDDWELRLYDPAGDRWLPTPSELFQSLDSAEQALRAAESENERLQKEVEKLRRRSDA